MNVQEVIAKLDTVRSEMHVYAALTGYLATELTPSDAPGEASEEMEQAYALGVLERVKEHLEEQTRVLQQQESALLEAEIDE